MDCTSSPPLHDYYLQIQEKDLTTKPKDSINHIDVHEFIFPHQDLQLPTFCKSLNCYLENIHAKIDAFTIEIATEYFVENDILLPYVHLENKTFVTINLGFVYFLQSNNEVNKVSIHSHEQERYECDFL